MRLKQNLWRTPIVISQETYPFLLTNKQPAPSINPANHSQYFTSVAKLFIFLRVVSEVPTKLENNRWLPAGSVNKLTLLPRFEPVVINLSNKLFQHIAQFCLSIKKRATKAGRF